MIKMYLKNIRDKVDRVEYKIFERDVVEDIDGQGAEWLKKHFEEVEQKLDSLNILASSYVNQN